MIISGSSNLIHGASTDKNKHPLPQSQSFGLAIDPGTRSPIKTQTGQSKLPPVSEYRLIGANGKSVPLEMMINPTSKGIVRGKLVDSGANSHAQHAISTYAENRDLEIRDQFKMMLGVDEYV